MKKANPIHVVRAGTDFFVVRNGIRIAKRGRPDTPQAKTWISLEPGFVVVDDFQQGGSTIAIGYTNPNAH